MPYDITIKHSIDPQRVADLMVTAIEGGSGYWCKSIDNDAPYGQASTYDRPINWTVHPDGGDPVQLTNEGILRGFCLMAEQYETSHWADFLEENEDADTADVFLQLALFG